MSIKSKKNKTSQFKELQLQVKELENKFKRALADYQNQQRRHQTQRQKLIQFANQTLLDKLLPVIDDLERAQKHLKNSGLKQIINQFCQVLNSEGLKPIKTDHQPFNPETMDCVEVVSGKKDIVVTTLTKGYFYHDRVLRPAKVEVGSGKLDKDK